jgi:hypothetical protein
MEIFRNQFFKLTKISGIVSCWTRQANRLYERHQVLTFSLIDTLAIRDHINVIKHLKDLRRRSVNRTNYSSSISGEAPQKIHA